MIFLKQNFENKVIMRLTDKAKFAEYYLFKITNEFSKDTFYYATNDISGQPCSYNMFIFDHNMSGSTSGGTNVQLAIPGGQYYYEVYETSQLTDDPQYVTNGPIESDMMVVQMIRTVNTPQSNWGNVYY
jgi:hypothetical protein